MSQSKIITSINALSNNINLEIDNNVVCIDVINNRIGVKQAQPACEVDVSGTIKTNYLQISKVNDISFENLAQKNTDVFLFEI